MSESWLTVIPTDPRWRPDEAMAEATVRVLQQLVPDATRIEIVDGTAVELIDAGENLTAVRCPRCGAELVTDWWIGAMDRAADQGFVDGGATGGFTDLSTEVPCCGALISLNDLDYDWPQGFARWRIEVFEPHCERLGDADVGQLSEALGHAVRIVYARY
jgi:hypothetical protein